MPGSLITDRVKQLVRMRGPVIPSQISKEIGTNILMASAILSELASSSDVKISSVKVGGTPLYYVAGQEAKLQNYTASLPQKEKEAFEQLKSAKALRDAELEPAIRVALRQIKDFAKPIDVAIDGQTELFWKWYLISNQDAEIAIKNLIGFTEEKAQAPEPFQQQQLAAEAAADKPIQSSTQQQQAVLMPQPQVAQQAMPISSARKARQALQKTTTAQTADFLIAVKEFFFKNEIEIISESLQKRSEAEYVILLPSLVGKLKYYCVAKSKKTCSESDISTAVVQGQLNKLPVLLLIKGELTKKAQELISKEIGAIVIKKI